MTPRAGIPSLIAVLQQTGAAAVVDARVYVKARKRGLSASQLAESFFALWAAGGERAEDFDHLQSDQALATLIGHELPAAQTARDVLAAFHADDLPLLQEGKATLDVDATVIHCSR